MNHRYCKDCGVFMGEEGTGRGHHVCPRPGWSFREWLEKELEIREMSLDDLYRKARITEAQLNEVDALRDDGLSLERILETVMAVKQALEISFNIFHAAKLPTYQRDYPFFEKGLSEHLQLLGEPNRKEAERQIDRLVASLIKKQNKSRAGNSKNRRKLQN